ncbi:hypothetical protein CLD20_14800 [Afifella sp. IM 167]|nr:hypothetical protein [Afifella sp. IM 167]
MQDKTSFREPAEHAFALAEIRLGFLDLPELDLVKQVVRRYGGQDHSRWVFRGRLNGEDVYIKVWNRSYVRRDNLRDGLRCGFYDQATAPALRALVTSNGLCRGYVTARCEPRRTLPQEFWELICARTAATGHFAVQFSPGHAMHFRGRRSLIDLEGIYPLARLDLVAGHHSAFAYRPYARYVTELAHAAHSGMGRAPALPPVEPASAWSEAPVQRLTRAMARRLAPAAPAEEPRLDLIEP